MSHVADGELHAWLDGALGHEVPGEARRVAAHLRSCGDCRARLEEVRALRERANELLGSAAAEVGEMPPFEEILARADISERGEQREVGATAGRGPGRPAPLRMLAWAASLVLGIAFGWAARSAWEVEANRGSLAVAERSEPLEQAAPILKEVDEVAGREDGAAPPSSGVAEPQGSAQSRSADADVADTRLADADVADTRLADRGVSGTPGEARRPEALREEETGTEAALEDVVAQRQLRKAGADALAAAATPVAAGAAGVTEEVWIPAAPEDAARWLGGQLLVVDGLPLIEVAVSTAEGTRVAFARQRLPSGDVLELRLRPARATKQDENEREPAFGAAGGRDAENRVREQVSLQARAEAKTPVAEPGRGVLGEAEGTTAGLEVRLRAPVASDSLRVLLSKLRPRGR